MDIKGLRRSDNVYQDIPQFDKYPEDWTIPLADQMLTELAKQYLRLTEPQPTYINGEPQYDISGGAGDMFSKRKEILDKVFFSPEGSIARTLTQEERQRLLQYINTMSNLGTRPDPIKVK